MVGRAGRRVLRELLPDLRAELDVRFVVANGENAAGGLGITPKEADELFRLGIDAITLGNHTYRHREIWPYLEQERRIVRPYNFLPSQPGRGTTTGSTRAGGAGDGSCKGCASSGAGSPTLSSVSCAMTRR